MPLLINNKKENAMNNDLDILKDINQSLGGQITLLIKKLNVAIEGLNAIISEGSDNLNIAEKTLKEIENCTVPQKDSEKEI